MNPANQPGDTSLGGGSPAFPSTIWGALDDLKSRKADPEAAMEQIVKRYWKPVYACIRIGMKHSNEDAKDLTQEFFLFLMESDALQGVDPKRGRFRSFLKTVLRNFVAGEHRKATRVKRGGRLRSIPMDVKDEDIVEAAAQDTGPEEVFDREWARSLVEQVVAECAADFKSTGREDQWLIFEAHDLASGAPASYQELGERFSLSEHQVKYILEETRRRLRDSVILKIREYALDEQEVWEELEYLMRLWRGF